MIKKALHDKLIAITNVTAALAAYPFSTGSAETPAVFAGRRIPEDAKFPCIFIRNSAASDWSVRSLKGAEAWFDVQIYANKNVTERALSNIAWNVWKELDCTSLTVEEYDCKACVADPPQQLNGDDDYPMYNVKVKVSILEQL